MKKFFANKDGITGFRFVADHPENDKYIVAINTDTGCPTRLLKTEWDSFFDTYKEASSRMIELAGAWFSFLRNQQAEISNTTTNH